MPARYPIKAAPLPTYAGTTNIFGPLIERFYHHYFVLQILSKYVKCGVPQLYFEIFAVFSLLFGYLACLVANH